MHSFILLAIIKKNLFILGLILLAFFGFIGLYKMLVGAIYNSYDCEQFTIDNIEVRTGIDIPKVVDMSCDYDAKVFVKKITFKIDSSKDMINDWLQKNDFQKIDAVYVNEGQRSDTKWQANYNFKSNDLMVTLFFL